MNTEELEALVCLSKEEKLFLYDRKIKEAIFDKERNIITIAQESLLCWTFFPDIGSHPKLGISFSSVEKILKNKAFKL